MGRLGNGTKWKVTISAIDKELIYVGDPMCSWCYGFLPVKRQLEDLCKDRALVSFVAGGLHIDWTEPQDDERKEFLRHHWDDVNQRSGQVFKYDILERDDFVYNTEPACRAVVTARDLDGNKTALPFFSKLQEAFYAENLDITQTDVLIEQAAAFGLDKSAFAERFSADPMRQQTMMDFQFAQRMGVTGFPTVVVNDKFGYAFLTVGYQPIDQLGQIVDAWLSDQLPRQQPNQQTAAE